MERIQRTILSVLAAASVAGVLQPNLSHAAPGASEPIDWQVTVDRPLIANRGVPENVVVKIEIAGCDTGFSKDRAPLNLSLVLDRSGSMAGAKLEQAKQAAAMLVDQLGPEDVLSLVVYETDIATLVPATRVGRNKSRLQKMIHGIQTGGSTALYGGVEAGATELAEFFDEERINRVILLSDGIANVGPSSNREIALLGKRLAERGMSVTTVGLGDDYNETLMTALAEASDANYYYVADVEALPSIFERELGELQSVVARDVVIRVRCPEGVRPLRFLGRPEEFGKQEATLRFGTLSGGQNRALYLECQVEPTALGKTTEIAQVALDFDPTGEAATRLSLSSPIVVGYTEDDVLAGKSVDQAVVAEALIWRNAMETEKSIAFADEGDFDSSRRNLASQKAALQSAYEVAPAAQQSLLKDEIAAVEEAEKELEADSFSKAMRKKLSAGAYETRNSKR